MRLGGLTAGEAQTMEDLFRECEGRRKEFMFVDPAANLLAGTGDVGGTAWDKGGGLLGESGVAGPEGQAGGFRLRNLSAGWSGVYQEIPAPETMTYCLSVWVKAGGTGRVRLRVGETVEEETAGSTWKRISATGSGRASPVRFELSCEAGGVVEMYGPQAEAQGSPSDYKRNTGRGGWYPRARFDMDELSLEAEGVGVYGGEVAIVSPWEE
jgi:hypothetical protein